MFQDEDLCSALGMGPTGHCVRHPNILVCSADGTTSVCRICDSEIRAGGVMQRKSIAYTIIQVQQLHNNKEKWKQLKQNWEADEDSRHEEEKKDKDSSAGASPLVTDKKSIVDENVTALSPRGDPVDSVRQAVLRASQMQEWAIIEKEKEIDQLKMDMQDLKSGYEQQINKLERINEGLQNRLTTLEELKSDCEQEISELEQVNEGLENRVTTLQSKVDKQERTIHQELKMIKSIAMKRADSRRGSVRSTVTTPRSENEKELSSSNLSIASQEAPPRLPARRASDKVPKQEKESLGHLDSPPGSHKEDPPKLPIRQISNQLPQLASFDEPPIDNKKSPQAASLSNRKVSFNNQQNNSPPSLPKRQASQKTRLSKKFVLAEPLVHSSFSEASTADNLREHSGLTNITNTSENEVITLDTETGEIKLQASGSKDPRSGNSSGVEEINHPPSIVQSNIPGLGEQRSLVEPEIPLGTQDLTAQQSDSTEIAFVPTASEIILEATSSSPPTLHSENSIVAPQVPNAAIDAGGSQEIQFDASSAFGVDYSREAGRRKSSVGEMEFDSTQQLLLEASRALSTAVILTPGTKQRQSIANEHEKKSPPLQPKQEIEFMAPKSHTKSLLERHLEREDANIFDPVKSKSHNDILQENIYGNAVMASHEDEQDDDYDYFDHADLPVTSKGFLECPTRTMNLSPVSALTTGSYLRDLGQQGDEDDEVAPRKALHSGGFTKKLPLEDDFDSEEDEEEGQAQQIAPDPPHVTTVTQSQTRQENKQHSTLGWNAEHLPEKQKYEFLDTDSPIASPQSIKPSVTGVDHTSGGKQKESKPPKQIYYVQDQTVQDKYGDGGTYTGTVSQEDRLPHGVGKMLYANERQYDGDWNDGRWHGCGRWINPNGDCYVGDFVYDARHGRGNYTWKNGNVYEGDFFDDKRQGKGKFNFANGNIYEGDFMNGVFEGNGRYTFEGGYYEGQWKSGRYNGYGFLMFADGSSYRGEFVDGVAHGQGEEAGTDGSVRKAVWENGRPR